MTDLQRIGSDNGVGLPVTLADGSRYIVPAFVLVNFAGAPVSAGSGGVDLDTNGDIVPTYKAHTFNYDGAGNLVGDVVMDGGNTWTRTYTYVNGVQKTDSGWVKS